LSKERGRLEPATGTRQFQTVMAKKTMFLAKSNYLEFSRNIVFGHNLQTANLRKPIKFSKDAYFFPVYFKRKNG